MLDVLSRGGGCGGGRGRLGASGEQSRERAALLVGEFDLVRAAAAAAAAAAVAKVNGRGRRGVIVISSRAHRPLVPCLTWLGGDGGLRGGSVRLTLRHQLHRGDRSERDDVLDVEAVLLELPQRARFRLAQLG